MTRVLGLALLLVLVLSAPAGASHSLRKTDARAGTIKFMGQIAWAFDKAQSGEKVHVRPALHCVRISHVTVTCPLTLRLPSSGAKLRGFVRVHRTSQGLLGFLLPWDPQVVSEVLAPSPS